MNGKLRLILSVFSLFLPFYLLTVMGSLPLAAWFVCSCLSATGIGAFLICLTDESRRKWSPWGIGAAAFFLGVPTISFVTVLLTMLSIPPTTAAAVTCILGVSGWIPAGMNLFRKQVHLRQAGIIPPILLILTVLIVILPFLHVGAETDRGFAYRAYFDHDFLVHLAVSAELSHGAIPPENPYYSGTSLHYYWLPFQFPAACYALSSYSVPLEKLQLYTNFFTGLAFVLLLTDLMLNWFRRSGPVFAGMISVLFLSSYEGIFWLIPRLLNHQPLQEFRNINIDGYTRWLFGTPQIDSLLRGLFFTPQHLIALGLFCIVINDLMVLPDTKLRRWPLPVMTAFFMISGCSIFVGGMLLILYVAFEILSTAISRTVRVSRILSAVLPMAVSLLIWMQLQMLTPAPGALNIGFQVGSAADAFRIFFLNFGALPVLAAAGLIWSCRDHRKIVAGMMILGLSALAFIFFFSIEDYTNEFGLRGGFLFFLAMLPGVIMLFNSAAKSPRTGLRFTVYLTAAALVLPGAVTSGMDIYNLQDIRNEKFTLYIPPQAMECLHWLRNNTPSDCTVQSAPEIWSTERNGNQPNLVPPFAERRLGVGHAYYAGQFQIGRTAAETRIDEIESILQSPHALDLLGASEQFGIRYWFIGPGEQSRFPEGMQKFTDAFLADAVKQDFPFTIFELNIHRLPQPVMTAVQNHHPLYFPPETGQRKVNSRPYLPGQHHRILKGLTPISGLESVELQHDWIFNPEHIIAPSALLATDHLALFTLASPPPTDLELLLFAPACPGAPVQWTGLYLDDEAVAFWKLNPGWHLYQLSLDTPPEPGSLFTLQCSLLRTAAEYCSGSYRIGTTSREAPDTILARSGPAPRGGFYGDVFFGGLNLSPHRPGYNLVPIPPDQPPVVLNLSGDVPDDLDKLETWLNHFPDGQIIAGVYVGEPALRISSRAWNELQKLGLEYKPEDSMYTSHAFIGVLGTPSSALEALGNDGPEFVYTGPNQGDKPFGFSMIPGIVSATTPLTPHQSNPED